MATEAEIEAAVDDVSFTVPCSRCGTIRVSYSALMGLPVNHHPVKHPLDDPDAVACSEMVDAEIRRRVTLADYGEDLPLNVIIPGSVSA